MIMTTTILSPPLAPGPGAAPPALILTGGASPLHAQTVAVMVNGEPITNYDIEQRSKLNFLTTHKPAVRQQVIDELIDEKVKIKEAKKFGVDPSASDIDQSFAAMSSRMRIDARAADEIARKPGHSAGHAEGPHQGRHGLDQPGARPVQGEPAGRREGRRRRRPGKATTTSRRPRAFEYKMQPIVLIVPRGSAPAAIEARRKEAEALREPRADLRRGQRLLQVHAKCRDTRDRDQDLGRHTGGRFAKCSTRRRSAI